MQRLLDPICLILALGAGLPASGADWPNHRGDSSLRGVSPERLGEELILQWTFEAGKFLKSSPVVAHGKVFLGGATGTFHALDAATGKEAWRFDAGLGVDAPALVVKDKVFLGSTDGWVHCLDAATGRKIWSYETQGEIVGAPNQALHPINGRPIILIGSYDNFVYCLDAETGSLVWKFETQNYLNGAPAIWDDKFAVFGGCDAKLYVLSLSDGNLSLEVEVGAPVASSIAVMDGFGYVGNMDRSVFAVDLISGKLLWSYQPKSFPYFSSPALTDELVLIGGRDKGLHAIDRLSGKQRWRYSALGRIDGSPVIAGEKAVVGSMDGKVLLINLSDGELIDSYETGASVSSTCAVANGWIFVGCEDGILYAFKSVDS